MKNLTALMKNGGLKPKERVLLLVYNFVAKDKTGEAILTETDKHALCEAWRPNNNSEIEEYNRYNSAWRIEGSAKLDAQAIYLCAQISLLKTGRLVDYVMFKDYTNIDSFFKGIDIGVNDGEALKFVLQNSGLVFDQVVHGLAFQNLSQDLRQDVLALCPDAETESQYLDQEESLAILFNGKEYLTSEAKEKLADLIIETIHNKYIKILKEKGSKMEEWWFHGYFAELQTIEIAKKWADDNGISYTDDEKLASVLSEKMEEYAEKNKTEVRELLKRTILRWLDQGLFVDEYAPIWNSNEKSTCNDMDTKQSHKKVLKEWLKAKAEAKATLQKLIDAGQLKIENREQDFYGMKEMVKIITGESLYVLEGDFVFASDFKKQADDLKPLGTLAIFVKKEKEFFEDYASLLAFVDIYKKLSRIYEIDMGYKIDNFIASLKVRVGLLNKELGYTTEKLTGMIYKKHNIKFLIEIIDSKVIQLEEIKPGTDEMETFYYNEFKEILGNEF